MLSRFKLNKLQSMVPDGPARFHHQDSLKCYRAGVYTMCPIAVWNAVFADLFQKIQHLAGVNKKFLKIAGDAEFQKNAKSPFEQQLKQDLKTAKLISEEQVQFLDELRDWRNDFAHPTERVITATKAGYFIEEGTRLFLSEESFNAHTVIHEIPANLQNPRFFASSMPARQLLAVRELMGTVTPHAYHNLIRNVVEVLESDSPVSSRNARAFLRCCIQLENQALTAVIFRYLIEPKLSLSDGIDDPYNRAIWDILIYAPGSIARLPVDQQEKLDKKLVTICTVIEEGREHRYSPIKLFGAILKAKPAVLKNVLRTTSLRIIREYPLSPELILGLQRLPERRSDIVASWKLTLLSRDPDQADAMRCFLDHHARRLAFVLDGPLAYSLLLPLSGDKEMKSGQIIFGTLSSIVMRWLESDLETARAQASRTGLLDPAEFMKVADLIKAPLEQIKVA